MTLQAFTVFFFLLLFSFLVLGYFHSFIGRSMAIHLLFTITVGTLVQCVVLKSVGISKNENYDELATYIHTVHNEWTGGKSKWNVKKNPNKSVVWQERCVMSTCLFFVLLPISTDVAIVLPQYFFFPLRFVRSSVHSFALVLRDIVPYPL